MDIYSILNGDDGVIVNSTYRNGISNESTHNLTENTAKHRHGSSGYDDTSKHGAGKVINLTPNEIYQDEMMKIQCEICGKQVKIDTFLNKLYSLMC